ncbi:hypothetical protein [Synechococcus phage S-B43]|jgi:hypothetical protein|nr:hypothetical protein [Synechococcus phage S-B43]
MDELMDMLVSPDESSSQISDKIKDILFAKSAEKIEANRPNVAASIFDAPEVEAEEEIETEASYGEAEEETEE